MAIAAISAEKLKLADVSSTHNEPIELANLLITSSLDSWQNVLDYCVREGVP